MKAIRINEYGGPEILHVENVPDPVAGPGQVLVRIHAASLNPVDLKFAAGAMKQLAPLTFPWTPGGDFSGVVEAVGPGVTEYDVRDEVFGSSPGGGAYAELIASDLKVIAYKPVTLGHAQSASTVMVGQTAWQALERANVQRGQRVLIHGAAGSVGAMAVQLAHLRGAYVIGTASGDGLVKARELGADEVIDYKTTPFETVVHDVDAVIDTVGGDTQQRSFGVLKTGGILIALTQPPSEEEAAKHNVQATIVRMQPSTANLKALADLIDSGQLQSSVSELFPIADAVKAWSGSKSGAIKGKIVFVVTS